MGAGAKRITLGSLQSVITPFSLIDQIILFLSVKINRQLTTTFFFGLDGVKFQNQLLLILYRFREE